MKRAMRVLSGSLLALAFAAATVGGCKARRDFPEPNVGWHSASYSVIFGRLRQVPGQTPDAAPIWVIRFGAGGDAYNGELALMPPEKMVGYRGGESVEIHGHLSEEPTNDLFNGRRYVVDSVQLWSGYQ